MTARLPKVSLPTVAAALVLSGCATGHRTLATDIDTWSATDVAAAICARRVSAESVVQAYLSRARSRPELNAFVTLDAKGALQAALDADARLARGEPCRPLQGVPIVIKDNIQVAGLPATAGTPALRDFIPLADAPVVKVLRDAGAIVLGKTNMHELAFGISGYNTSFNTGPRPGVRNAYDVSRAAGGSSSGSGAALGARMAPMALGTDTGGSLRIPCAFNGCVSLRPSVGRYSQEGIAPISHTRDTAGPMAISVADVELLDRLVTGAPRASAADLRSVRLGLVPDFLANLDADTRAAFDAAIGKLRSAGATVIEVQMPGLGTLNAAIGFPLALYEAHDDMVAYLARYRPELDIRQLASEIASPDVKGTFDALVLPRQLPAPGGTVPARPVYEAAMATHRPALQRLYAATFAQHRLDALVFPTTPKVAMAATPDASSVENFVLYIQNTDPGSNSGIPGLQLPMGMGTQVKVPIGLELDGPAGSDRRLVAIGMAVEAVLGRLPAPSPSTAAR